MKIGCNGQEPDLDWLKDLWCVCLSAKPSTATKSLAFKWLGRQWKEAHVKLTSIGSSKKHYKD